MDSHQVRQKYIDFFVKRGHKQIPSAPLVPENDPTTLFTGSGMQPMVPYLLGQPHPLGTRLVDSQKCFRAQDIEEIGNNRHDTFFEMLGNWSLGDYFKNDQVKWLLQFLTDKKIGLGLNPNRLYVSVFRGKPEINIPRDEEAVKLWQQEFKEIGIDAKVVDYAERDGMQGGRIFYYDATKNWWSRAGVPENMPVGEPGGPDSEVFFDFDTPHNPKFGKHCHPNCDCGRFMEIGNSVFMAYKKTEKGFVPLEKKNIDFGGGLERLAAACNDDPDIFNTDLFFQIIKTVEANSNKNYSDDKQKAAMRVVADHLKAATFLIVDGVVPSNKTQGYFLRRLLRRAAVKMHELRGGSTPITAFKSICESVFKTYRETDYFNEDKNRHTIESVLAEEMSKFSTTLDRGLREFNKYTGSELNAINAFNLYQTYGFPFEITEELYRKRGKKLDGTEFNKIFDSHKQLSRTASAGMFKGGLADHSKEVIRLHTATHLLHQALRQVLGSHVQQQGSNITADRLRFDFTHPQAIIPEEIKKIEALVNQKISEDLPVHHTMEPKDKALKSGALAFFRDKYADTVSVYTIGKDHDTDWFSKELCGGPHVTSTGVIGPVRIKKTESVGGGVRRIYAFLEPAHQIKSS